MFAFKPPAFAACDTEPDAPDCPCFDDTGAWNPSGAYIQDVALDTLGTKESCPCPGTTGCNWEVSPTDEFTNAGKPYYQMVLGANSESFAMTLAWIEHTLGFLPGRQAWCSETISYWHREAGVPYSNGYENFWHSTWQNNSVSDLRTWYETEEFMWIFPLHGRGRWINCHELDYGNFELGVTVPVPGSYVAIRGFHKGLIMSWWQSLSNSHSLMIDEMWVHKDILGKVFQIEVTLLEGNSGNRVRNDHSYDDLWSVTPAGPDWIGSDRKIYGFGVDLNSNRQPIYDPSRLHYVYHNNVNLVPELMQELPDREWDILGKRIPRLRDYARMLAEEGGPKVTSSSSQIKVPAIPDGNNIKWYFPKEQQGQVEILIDLMDVHPLGIRGIALTWGGQFVPKGYSVQHSTDGKAYRNAMLPDLSNVRFPQQMPLIPIPARFSESPEGVAVRYVRIIFPRGTFQNDAVVRALRFEYERSPWEDAEDNPPCERDIPGDINGDCIVDFRDFAIMAAHWLEQS